MGAVIGELLPLALGVAISPIPIIAVILMLLAPKAGGTSFGFLGGWVAGIIATTVLFVVLAEITGSESSDQPSAVASWIKIALGALMLLLALKQWRSRPGEGEEPSLPGWMSAIDRFSPVKSAGLGFVLSAVNPKNLAMAIAAGVVVGGAALSMAETTVAVAVAVFTVIAASTVAVPVIVYALAADQMAKPLDAMHRWLVQNNATVMVVLLLVIGVVLLGKGIGGLF